MLSFAKRFVFFVWAASAWIPITAQAGLFGPSNVTECREKYIRNVRLPAGRQTVGRACAWQHNDLASAKNKKFAACLLDDSSNFYSEDSIRKSINKCANKYDNQQGFNVFSGALDESRMPPSAQGVPLPPSSDGPFLIHDGQTGNVINCFKIGTTIDCN